MKKSLEKTEGYCRKKYRMKREAAGSSDTVRPLPVVISDAEDPDETVICQADMCSGEIKQIQTGHFVVFPADVSVQDGNGQFAGP